MTRHDVQLWAYAAKELELGDHRYVEAHLEDCPECVEQLASVQVAKEALELARDAKPRVAWAKVDERIGKMVEKGLARQARRPLFVRLGFVGMGLAVAATALFFIAFPTREELMPLPSIQQPVPTSSWARVDRAQGLMKVDGTSRELFDGTELAGGDVLRTNNLGKAYVHLPDGSHLRVGGASQLALTRSEADDVALTLERGSLAVRASHQVRKGFVVHSGGLSVNVVGTVFGVSNDAEQVEVTVIEGKVRVELPDGETVFVTPGQRLRFDSKSQKSKTLKLTDANERELNEVAAVADATTSVEQQAVVAAVGGAPTAPPMLTARGTPRSLPRLSVAEAKARQVQAPEVAPAPANDEPVPFPKGKIEDGKTEVIVEGPEAVWPTLGGGDIVRGVPVPVNAPKREPVVVEPPPISQPTEWADAPKPSVDEWQEMPAPAPTTVARLADEPAPAAAPVVIEKSKVTPKDLESIFLERAEESIAKGSCDRFLLGLEDIATDPESPRSEQARVMRARCFDSQMRPRQAMNEYRKYLELHPRGKFASEAHQALGD